VDDFASLVGYITKIGKKKRPSVYYFLGREKERFCLVFCFLLSKEKENPS
jgi:hypothetical protein